MSVFDRRPKQLNSRDETQIDAAAAASSFIVRSWSVGGPDQSLARVGALARRIARRSCHAQAVRSFGMERRKMHPRNKYAEKPPDFHRLAELYPDFQQYVSYSSNQQQQQQQPQPRARIDWTDFNATRALTRALLHHDYGISWWIPDGQLCPAVPNRANYIHWIEDLLTLAPAPWHASGAHSVVGIDIGTGANCIYPLLGVSLHGWKFVGTDITPVALEWAKWNVDCNPHISPLIEIRSATLNGRSDLNACTQGVIGPALPPPKQGPVVVQDSKEILTEEDHRGPPETDQAPDEEPTSENDAGPGSWGVLVGVVREEERFDFCMCNPPFFASMEEANLNPRTACGGTAAEMVCAGGEEAFVARIIDDSAQLKHVIHWFTTMVGRKVTLKGLSAKLWALGAAAVRTTEFVQGRTSRWGLAWSFNHAPAHAMKNPGLSKSHHSFMLEGLGRKCTAADMLQALATELQALGASCTVSVPDFSISGFLPDGEEALDVLGKRKRESIDKPSSQVVVSWKDATRSFNAWVFQQAPGSLLVKASLSKGSKHGGAFADVLQRVEESLKQRFQSK